jgi:hypothetical protein
MRFIILIFTLSGLFVSPVYSGIAEKTSLCFPIMSSALYDQRGNFNGQPIKDFLDDRSNQGNDEKKVLHELGAINGNEMITFDGQDYYRYNMLSLNYENEHGDLLKYFRRSFDGDTVIIQVKANMWQDLDDVFSEIKLWRCNVSMTRDETPSEYSLGFEIGMKRGMAFREYMMKLKEIEGKCRDIVFFCD